MTKTMRLKKEKGFTLIETLVTFVVMTVGLLGVASLQMTGMKAVQGSLYRYQAVRLAEDLTDRIRANVDGLRDGEYTATDVKANVSAMSCTADSCKLSERDLQEWYTELERVLHIATGETEAKASIACSDGVCAEDAMVTIRVDWRERVDHSELDADETSVTETGDLTVVNSFALNTVF